jgi:DNA-binding SARP family transcriptional activator
MAILSFENGDFEESIRKFEELNALLFKNKIKEYAGWNYTCIGEAFYYLQKYDAALKNFEIAQSYIDKNNEYQLLVISYLSVKSSNKIKFQLDTEKTLLDKLNFNKENNLLQEQTQIEFHLADFYLRAGSSDTALKYLKSCLDISSGKQYLSFLESEVVNSRHVFDFAISNNLQKQFVKTIFENVKEKINYEWLSSEYKKRLADEVESLTDLKLYSFGKTEIRLRGTPIKEEKWVRKKSKIILAYLLTKPDMVLNKDKIIDLFLQDVPLENADTIFHNILSNIRSAIKVTYPDYELETALKGTKNSSKQISPVFTVYENKNLSLNKDYNYDSDCREFDRYFNLASSASSKLSEKTKASVKAVNLYNGEFMPGHYDPWCEEMRQNYSNMFQKLCEELISVFYSTGKYEDTIKYAEKLLETDKLHQEAYLKIIESNVKLRKLNSAKDKFSLMLKNYNEELGEKPERQVLSKINDLLADL